MPRSNRPRGRRRPVVDEEEDGLSRLLAGWKRTEVRRGVSWYVQPMTAERSVKDYVCPGCGGVVAQGTAHLVTWRADDVTGDRAALESRRHWHTHCWSIA